MFNVKVSANFIQQNLKDIKKLADGDTEALKRLQKKAAEDYIINLVGKANLNEWNGGVTPQIFIDDIEIIDLMEGF